MALKALLKSLDEVDEQFQSLYVKEGDVFVLAVDDTDYKQTLGEFRNNNIELTKKLQQAEGASEELAALKEQVEKFQGIDPEKAKEAMDKIRNIEEKQLIDAGEIDTVIEQRVAQRVERMRADLEGKVNAATKRNEQLEAENGKYKGRLSEVVIDSALQQAVSNVAPIRKGAMRDAIARGREVWTLDENGQPVPMIKGANGKEVMYGSDGKTVLSMDEWAQSLAMEAPYLFEGNAGGGANGNLSGSEQKGVVKASDQASLGANLEAIAAGEVVVSNE